MPSCSSLTLPFECQPHPTPEVDLMLLELSGGEEWMLDTAHHGFLGDLQSEASISPPLRECTAGTLCSLLPLAGSPAFFLTFRCPVTSFATWNAFLIACSLGLSLFSLILKLLCTTKAQLWIYHRAPDSLCSLPFLSPFIQFLQAQWPPIFDVVHRSNHQTVVSLAEKLLWLFSFRKPSLIKVLGAGVYHVLFSHTCAHSVFPKITF